MASKTIETGAKMMGECQCCGRMVAITDGTTSLHGYSVRAGGGMSRIGGESCPGSNRRPAPAFDAIEEALERAKGLVTDGLSRLDRQSAESNVRVLTRKLEAMKARSAA